MHRPAVFCLAAAFLLLTLSLPAFAASAHDPQAGEGLFGIGIGTLSGNTLYHISVYDATGGIESELEFPLNTVLLGLEGGYITRNAQGKDAFRISFQWFTSLGSGSGKLKDSDWISGTAETGPPLNFPAHPGLDIYSESDIALTANIVDLRASYNYWQSEGFAIGPLGGILYQNFQFDASNVNQVGYGPYDPAYTVSVSGLVLTYEVTYTVPYIGIHSQLIAGAGFEMAIDLGFSPWAWAADRDDHVLRSKLSEGSASGNAYLATLTAQWDIGDKDTFSMRGQYLKIDTSGTQTQTWYRAPNPDGLPAGYTITGIDDKITSQQVSASLTYSHRF